MGHLSSESIDIDPQRTIRNRGPDAARPGVRCCLVAALPGVDTTLLGGNDNETHLTPQR